MTLPGGIGALHLRVYDGGGTPHIHTVCAEAYVVVGGRGAAQTLTLAEGFRAIPLEPGAVVSFPPGTLHRLVNDDALELYVLMSNAGLPESGDMVITFEPGVLADPARYVAAATLQEPALVGAATRRDRGVEGFLRLRAGGEKALRAFHEAAARLVEPKVDGWRTRLQRDRTDAMLDALAASDIGHFADARVVRHHTVDRFGSCGTLGAYVV